MKTQRMSIAEFMSGDYKKTPRQSKVTATMLFGGLPLFVTTPLLAVPQVSSAAGTPEAVATIASSQEIYDKMMIAFEPITTLIQALAYPVASVVVLAGALFVMINQKEKGFGMMSSAGLGVILVNLMPMVLNILVDIMKGL
jgi:hypothetical protein